MGEYNFNKDLISGQEGEDVVKNHAMLITGATFVNTNHTNHYDFMLEKNGVRKMYEVKTEEYCKPGRDNGNLFVEIESWGKNSGIMVTMADWYVFHLPYRNQIWYIETDRLLHLLETNDFRKTSNSGDKNSGTIGYLIPRRNFIEHFKVYHI